MIVYKTSVLRDDELIAEFYEDALGDAVNVAERVVKTNDIVSISTALKCLDGYTETDDPLIMCYKIDTVPKYLKFAYWNYTMMCVFLILKVLLIVLLILIYINNNIYFKYIHKGVLNDYNLVECRSY